MKGPKALWQNQTIACKSGKTVPHGTRCACKKQETRERNRRHYVNRPTARHRGYSRAWERERDLWLAHHPA